MEVTIPRQGVGRDGREWSAEPITFREVAYEVCNQARTVLESVGTRPLNPYLLEVPHSPVWDSRAQRELLRLLFIARQALARDDRNQAQRALGIWHSVRQQSTPQPLVLEPEDRGVTPYQGTIIRTWRFRDVLSELFYDRAIWTLRRQDSSWRDVREAFARCVTNAGEDLASGQAAADIRMIDRLIAEEEAHDAVALPPFAERSEEQMLAELVFQIRNVTSDRSRRTIQNLFDPPREDEPVLDQLIGMGLAAVPTLIDLIADERFTRCVYTGPGWWSGPTPPPLPPLPIILRYQTVAVTALQHISGLSRYVSLGREIIPSPIVRSLQDFYRTWYEHVQDVGLAVSLEEILRAGGSEAAMAAPRLFLLAPERFPEAVQVALERMRGRTDGYTMLRLLLQLDSETARELVFTEVETVPLTRNYSSFMIDTHRRFPDRVEAILVRRWENLGPFGEEGTPGDGGPLTREGVDAVAVLARATLPLGEGPVLRAMTARLWALGPLHRQWVVRELHNDGRLPVRGDLVEPLRESETLETFLVTMLERDLQQWDRRGPWVIRYDWPVDSRLCDEAGAVLARLWPDRYHYNFVADRYEREVDRITCLNTWREMHELSPLPLPAPPPPPLPPMEETPEEYPQSQPQSQPGR